MKFIIRSPSMSETAMSTDKAREALKAFQELAKHAASATDLHNAFFGIGGKLGELFPTREEREAFAKTPEYAEIVRRKLEMRQNESVSA